MNKRRLKILGVIFTLNVWVAVNITVLFVHHDFFYSHLPGLVLFITGVLVWVTIISPMLNRWSHEESDSQS